jgi:SNF2 family DNA or RNA helicase
MFTIRLSLNGEHVEANPTKRLDGTWFSTYLDAVSQVGGRFNPNRKCQQFKLPRLADAIKSLKGAGFAVEVDETIGARIEGALSTNASERETARALHDAAIERIETIDERLAARGLALYPYQKDGVRWMSHRRGAGLFDEMGLGKTVQALIAAPEGAPILVVCPAAVKGVWSKETRRWRPDLGWPIPLSGRNSFRWPRAGEIIVTNYDILPEPEIHTTDKGRNVYTLPDWVGAPSEGTVLIYDEFHALKNPSARRTRASKLLTKRVIAAKGFCWGLTGTPMLNRPRELWNVLEAIGVAQEAYGSFGAFHRLFDWNDQPKPEVADKLRKVSLMRRRLEVLPDLPTKSYEDISVAIDDDTRRLADDIVRKLEAAGMSLANIQSIADLVSSTKHARLDIGEISRVRAALAKAKVGRMVELAEQYEAEGKPLVVFSAHRGPVDLLGQRDGWTTITGDVESSERTRRVAEFAAGGLKGIACTIKAAGVGIDGLQKASHDALFVDLDWTPGWNQQAEDRICRIGQDRGVNIVTMIADHELDRKVHDLLTHKARIIEGSVNASARSTVEEQFPETGTSDPDVTIKPAAEAEKERAAREAVTGAPVPVGNLWERFAAVVASGLARPTLKLESFQLRMAGPASKYHGQVMVTNGKPYGDPANEWYGRITRQGFYRTRGCPDAVVETIQKWNEDPAALMLDAMAYGHRTGLCCFCSIPLTDGRSVTVGYGPICASHFDLPWGEADDMRVNLPPDVFAGDQS